MKLVEMIMEHNFWVQLTELAEQIPWLVTFDIYVFAERKEHDNQPVFGHSFCFSASAFSSIIIHYCDSTAGVDLLFHYQLHRN
jgi:hypothetical protein